MPVSIRRVNRKWRIVEPGGGISTTPNGNARDGHGHATRAEALRQMRAINMHVAEKSESPYGDVEYADPGYQSDKQKRYPVDTPEHIRAAWSYIHHDKDAGKYSPEHLSHIRSKIVAAWKRKIDPAGPPEAKAWSDDPDGTKPFKPNEDLNPFYPPKPKPRKRPK